MHSVRLRRCRTSDGLRTSPDQCRLATAVKADEQARSRMSVSSSGVYGLESWVSQVRLRSISTIPWQSLQACPLGSLELEPCSLYNRTLSCPKLAGQGCRRMTASEARTGAPRVSGPEIAELVGRGASSSIRLLCLQKPVKKQGLPSTLTKIQVDFLPASSPSRFGALHPQSIALQRRCST